MSSECHGALKLLSVPEAAAILGISRQAVSIRCQRGSVVGAMRVGKSYVIPDPPLLINAQGKSRPAQWAATEEALQLVAQGMTAYAAAKEKGVAVSSVYRALKKKE